MDDTRRDFLKASILASGAALLPRFALAARSLSDPRLLVVLLRGGMDGLHAVQAPGDPAFGGLRGRLLDADRAGAARRLDASFALHPSLAFAHTLYGRGQFMPVVAVAPPYRQRSHFEAQDCLENGTGAPGARTGWMNRCVAAMPGGAGLALAAVMPLAMRGAAGIATWSPPLPEALDPILMQRLQVLYAADPALAPTFASMAGQDAAMTGTARGGRRGARLPALMAAAARFMAQPQGPRIAFVEDAGWDTHGNQAGILANKLKELDDGLAAFHAGAQSIWNGTVVAVVSEFGRTAAINGTLGTDHGTGGVAFLAGAPVNGGRVAGDWPGLADEQLNEGRDLRATTDVRAVFKGVLHAHLHLPKAVLDARVFPNSAALPPLAGLIRGA